jgi:hypothetical protein
MRATNIGNLYKIDGSTEINEAVVVAKEANESTHL